MKTTRLAVSRRQALGGLLLSTTGLLRSASAAAERRRLALPPLEDGYSRLWLLRHGETDWNVAERVQGRTDNVLNANGRAQAAALARYLSDEDFDLIASSGLDRAVATADAVAAGRPSCARAQDARFGEMCFGDLEGARLDDMQPEYQAMLRRWRGGDTSAAWPGFSRLGGTSRLRGESVDDVAARGVAGLRALGLGSGAADGPRHVALVAHGRFNKILISELQGDRSRCSEIQQGNTCINVLDVPQDGGACKVQALDVRDHLEASELSSV